MDKKKLLDIIENFKDRNNADLMKALDVLQDEYEATKKTIIDLTLHLDTVEKHFYTLSDEIKQRMK